MEKVWGELRKIEAKAEQIKTEANERSSQITNIAERKSEQLIASAKVFASEEAEKQREAILKQAQEIHDHKIIENQQKTKKITECAQRNMEKAVRKIIDAVIGEGNVGSDNEIR